MNLNWLRLSLRELLLVFVCVGLGLGWYQEYQLSRPTRDALEDFYAAKQFFAEQGLVAYGHGEGGYRDVQVQVVVASQSDISRQFFLNP